MPSIGMSLGTCTRTVLFCIGPLERPPGGVVVENKKRKKVIPLDGFPFNAVQELEKFCFFLYNSSFQIMEKKEKVFAKYTCKTTLSIFFPELDKKDYI